MGPEVVRRARQCIRYRGHLLVEVDREAIESEQAPLSGDRRIVVYIMNADPTGNLRAIGKAPYVNLARKRVDELLGA